MKYDKATIVDAIGTVLSQNDIVKLMQHIEQSVDKEEEEQKNEWSQKESNNDDTDDEDEEEDAVLSANIEYMKKYGFRPSWQTLEQSELKKMIDSNNDDFVILDVRTPQFDYKGGKIVGAINIPSNIFDAKIHKSVIRYINYKNVIIHCMYSQMRGPTCCNYYYNALQEICSNYKNNTKQPKFQYSLQKLIKIYDEIDDNKYEKLYNQNIYLLEGGFNQWINQCIKNKKDMKKYVQDYDETLWEIEFEKLVHKLDWNTKDAITQNDASSSSD